ADTRAAVRTAAEALTRAGFQVEPFRPDGLELARQLWWKFFGIAGGMLLGPMTRGHEAELSPILKEFSSWVEAEPSHTGESLLDAWIQRDAIRMQIFAQMRDYPVLLCPVAAIPAFKHGERRWQIDGKTVEYLDAWSYTEWFNLLGTPAAVVPVGQSPEGLPIGVQISARPWEEELVLSVAAELETQCGVWRAPVLEQGFSALLVFLVVSATYLYTFPQPNIFYAVIVLLHATTGVVAAVMLAIFFFRLLRNGSFAARAGWVLLAAGAVIGIVLIKTGTPRVEWNWLYVHILLSLAGVGILFADWAGNRGWLGIGAARAVLRLAICLLALAGLGYGARYVRES